MSIDVRFDLPLLTGHDAARALDVPTATVSRWVHQELVHATPSSGRHDPTIPFIGVVEVHALRALREAGIKMREIHDARTRLSRQLETAYPLASSRLSTVGMDILWHREGQWEVARDGTVQPQQLVEQYLKDVTYGDDDLATRIRLRGYEGAEVIIDPRFNFGQPVFARSKAAVEDVLDAFYAGEPLNVVAAQFRVETSDIEAALRTQRPAA